MDSERVSTYGRHYPAYARLGSAYLAKVRQTQDPFPLREARRNFKRSLEIQSNLEAIKGMAALYSYSHRFEEALRWARRASEVAPTDTSATLLLVEAYLGLGRGGEVVRLLSERNPEASDFFTEAAQGRAFMERRHFRAAAGAFSRAAAFARRSADAILLTARATGLFHGVMSPTIPTGQVLS